MLALFMIAETAGSETGARPTPALRRLIGALPGLAAGHIMIADRSPAEQPFSADGRGPDLVLEVVFADRQAAAAALVATSVLADLPALIGAPVDAISHQLMEVHAFPVEPGPGPDPFCTFFVTYPGTTGNLPGWLAHYDAHHPPIMRRFPKIRDVATYWPLDWASALPFHRGTAMQRNKVVFDRLDDLVAALASPVMAEMRADSAGFQPMTARATHFPMRTWRV